MNRRRFRVNASFILVASLCATIVCAQNPKAAESVDLGNGVTMSFIHVEPGTFTQGSPETEPGRSADELPRSVTLTRSFYIGQFPVTVGQFARFVDETRYRTEAETGASGGYGWDGTKLVQRKDFTWKNPGFTQTNEHPVVLVTYPDAEAFAAWLSRKAGRKCQLPTEAQWEYACRAGTNSAFPFGPSREAAEQSIWYKNSSGNGTQPVGQKPANPWGVHDMLGQVWEWCRDMYGPYQPGPIKDPVALQPGPGERPRRVLRGGSWLKELDSCRPATRYRNDPRSRNADNGFRVVSFVEAPTLSPPPTAAAAAASSRTEPQLERENSAVPTRSSSESRPEDFRKETRPSRKGVNIIGLIVGGAILFLIYRLVRALSRSSFRPLEAIGTLGGGAASGGRAGGPISTRVVEDGFWIRSNMLSPGSLVSCRYTTEGRPQEMNVRYEPGAEGHFIYTGSRPSSVSVVVAPGGGPTDITREPPPLFQQPPDDEDNDNRRHRGFPRAY